MLGTMLWVNVGVAGVEIKNLRSEYLENPLFIVRDRPPTGAKFHTAAQLGPQGTTPLVSAPYHGTVYFHFEPIATHLKNKPRLRLVFRAARRKPWRRFNHQIISSTARGRRLRGNCFPPLTARRGGRTQNIRKNCLCPFPARVRRDVRGIAAPRARRSSCNSGTRAGRRGISCKLRRVRDCPRACRAHRSCDNVVSWVDIKPSKHPKNQMRKV